jgi:hypothetical protein
MASALFQMMVGGLGLTLSTTAVADVPVLGWLSHRDAVSDPVSASSIGAGSADALTVLAEPEANDVALPQAASPGLAESITISTSAGVIFLPRGFVSRDGRFDLVVHFHGGAQVVAPELEQAGLKSALIVINLGVGSGAYERAFEGGRPLEARIAWVEDKLAERGIVKDAKVDRVALSAWSAGYGAIRKILTHKRTEARVESVLLSDGLHAGFERGSRTEVDHLKMAPFERFAKRAAEGRGLMAISHSAVPTYKYASTTQTADYLIRSVGASRVPGEGFVAPGLARSSSAKKGDFSVVGFGKNDTDAHCEHLIHIGESLFPALARHWSPAASS